MYKVSVVIPVYGVEKYIERCARSLFEQTLDDIEYIFVNDCTPDSSISILNKVIKEYPSRINQVKIINHNRNLGLPQARKSGILQSTGEYLIHCDSDDWVEKNAYQLLWEKAKEKDCDVVFCDFYHSDGTTHKHQHRYFGNFNKDTILLYVVRKVLWSLCGALVKTKIYKNNEFYFPTNNNFEDLVLMTQIILSSSKYEHIPIPLYYYYNNQKSMSKILDVDAIIKRLNDAIVNSSFVVNYLINNNYKHTKDISLILKLQSRYILSSITNQQKYYNMWFKVYPEVDNEIFIFNKNIPFSFKIHYWAVKLRIFDNLKLIQNRFNRI